MEYEIIRRPLSVEIRPTCNKFCMSSLIIYLMAEFRGHKVKRIGDSIIIEDEEKHEGTEELFKKIQTAMSERPEKIIVLHVRKVPRIFPKVLHLN